MRGRARTEQSAASCRLGAERASACTEAGRPKACRSGRGAERARRAKAGGFGLLAKRTWKTALIKGKREYSSAHRMQAMSKSTHQTRALLAAVTGQRRRRYRSLAGGQHEVIYKEPRRTSESRLLRRLAKCARLSLLLLLLLRLTPAAACV